MEIILLGPRDTSIPIQNGNMPMEDWLNMHCELHGPFVDEAAAKAWLADIDLDEDRFWAILALQSEGAYSQVKK